MSEIEGETPAHRRARLMRRARRWALELALGLSFLVCVFIAERLGAGGAAVAAIAAAVAVLTAWFVFYIRWRLSFDEFARTLELRAIALAAGVVIVAASGWGLAELILDAPAAPIVFVAPAFSVVYGIIRLLMGRAYR